jgi:hypothetical protein
MHALVHINLLFSVSYLQPFAWFSSNPNIYYQHCTQIDRLYRLRSPQQTRTWSLYGNRWKKENPNHQVGTGMRSDPLQSHARMQGRLLAGFKFISSHLITCREFICLRTFNQESKNNAQETRTWSLAGIGRRKKTQILK